jgi:uncharacterized protein (DUF488 family)
VRVLTIGHGRRTLEELVRCLEETGATTLVDVRRQPGSRRNPQFNQAPLLAALAPVGIGYRHAVDLGGLLEDEPGEEDFACLKPQPLASYAARMRTSGWHEALGRALAEPGPCLMCSERAWQKCHRSLISELLAARGHEVVHVIAPGDSQPHVPRATAETRAGILYLCGSPVA